MSIQHRCAMTNWRACDAASLSLPPAVPSRHIFLRTTAASAAAARALLRSPTSSAAAQQMGRLLAALQSSAQLKLVPMAPSVRRRQHAASSRCDDERFGRTRASVPRVPSLAVGMTNSRSLSNRRTSQRPQRRIGSSKSGHRHRLRSRRLGQHPSQSAALPNAAPRPVGMRRGALAAVLLTRASRQGAPLRAIASGTWRRS